ncbi:MAG: hypothetical protein WBL53_01250, partial [Pseudonocardiaceae bacterium]
MIDTSTHKPADQAQNPIFEPHTVKEKYGTSKDAVAELTTTHRQALEAYRRQKGQWISPPLNHD